MNSKKFLTLFLLLLCLFTVARAADEDDDVPNVDDTEEKESNETSAAAKEPVKTTTVEPVKTTVAPAPTTVKIQVTTTVPIQKLPTTKPQPTPVQTTAVTQNSQVVPKTPTTVQNSQKSTAQNQSTINNKVNAVPTNNKVSTTNNTTTQANKVTTSANNASKVANKGSTQANNAAGATTGAAAGAAAGATIGATTGATTGANNGANTGANTGAAPNTDLGTIPGATDATTGIPGAGAPTVPGAPNGAQNPIIPNNNASQTSRTVDNNNNTANVGDNNESKNDNKTAIKTTLISLVAVGAVVGVATVGVRVYNKKTENRGFDIADIEAQPINNDFGKSNNELSGMQNGMYSPEAYSPYNVMNEVTNNNPFSPYSLYENRPEEKIDTTPFNKVESNQDNFMGRESIFSNPANKIPQISNDVYNFKEGTKLPYVQELPVENTYIEEPVANQIEVENSLPSTQMPTLVPVQPEVVITKPDDEPAQGYKQIVPNVAQMKIVNTPDFNNMTTSMIEDHINNMELENLANTDTQQDPDTGYKEIIPDIQEAVIENFDVDDDEEDQTNVDNITDTYRAALRATYCSTGSDENRFSYKTVDSDHSLLHTMRGEGGEW